MKAFKSIGRRLFVGFALIYTATLLALGVEFIVRRTISGNLEYLVTDRLSGVVDDIVGVTAGLEAQQRLSVAGSSVPAQEVEEVKSRLESKYESALQLSANDSEARQLIQAAADLTVRWFSTFTTSIDPRATPSPPFGAGPVVSLQATVESAQLFAQIKQTHAKLSNHLRTRYQLVANRIQGFSSSVDRILLVLLVSTLLLIAVLSVYVPNEVGKRIQKLIKITKEVETGQYVPGLRQHPDDDFGDLGQALDRMAQALTEKEKKLQKSLKELEVINRDLEVAVQERTRELRAAQEELIKQERLSALGQMASGIAHDISNALSPVVGYADLLHSTTDNLSEEQRSFIEMIRTSATDVSQLLNRMRKFYRPRDESQPLMPLQLNELAKQAVDLTRPRWKDISQERGVVIAIDLELQEDLPTVLGIESEIREALTNVVINAVDAMPRGGTITIRTRSFPWIVGMAASAEPFVFLEVADTGVGMDDETKRRCLEPFFTTKGELGTGLGLSMAYGVMRRHQGSIEIESQCNQGTTVRLILPAGWIVEKPAQEEVKFPHHASGLRILVVDDEARLRKLIRAMLEKDEHLVTLADGGEAGLEAFRAARACGEPFDVVITDLGMPYVDGRLVARTVKREAPRTSVILLTGWGTRTQADGEVLKDVDAVLSKPPRLEELLSTVAWATRHLATRQPAEMASSHSLRA